MKKTILYRLLGLGAIPRKLSPVLEEEGVVVADEGMAGRFITKDVKGPGRRYIHRSEGFSGCLVITRKRVVCFTYGKCQISLSTDDPKTAELFVTTPNDTTFSLSFESSAFREGWEGVIEYRFKTDKALQFCEAFMSIGARRGSAGGKPQTPQ